jgi:hypothetical protein
MTVNGTPYPPLCAKADQLLIIPPGSQIWQICAGMGIARSRLCSGSYASRLADASVRPLTSRG